MCTTAPKSEVEETDTATPLKNPPCESSQEAPHPIMTCATDFPPHSSPFQLSVQNQTSTSPYHFRRRKYPTNFAPSSGLYHFQCRGTGTSRAQMRNTRAPDHEERKRNPCPHRCIRTPTRASRQPTQQLRAWCRRLACGGHPCSLHLTGVRTTSVPKKPAEWRPHEFSTCQLSVPFSVPENRHSGRREHLPAVRTAFSAETNGRRTEKLRAARS